MKFFNLFKKEIREMVTVQTLIGILVALLIFLLLGQVMGNVTENISAKMGSVVLVDEDQSDYSALALAQLEEQGYHIDQIGPAEDTALIEKAGEFDHTAVLVIPEGFGAGLDAGKPQQLRIISALTSFSIMSATDSSASAAAQIISDTFSTVMIQKQDAAANVDFIKAPVSSYDVTVANGKSAEVNSNMLMSFAMQQSLFVPIIVFMLITFASQMNASAIANEKSDKTLETLLSAPVSRISVLGAKMCASGVLSLFMAAIYMVGFSSYMGGMMGGGEAANGVNQVMESLGLAMSPLQYVLLGIQLFLTIMIALAVSMILGALAKDIKSASSLMMPLMFLSMIPYFVTIFMDVNTLPLPAQILLYLIPFTHTYCASANLLFGNNLLFFGGMAYQLILLIIVMAMTVHVFSTDKIFTMTLGGPKTRKNKKGAPAEA